MVQIKDIEAYWNSHPCEGTLYFEKANKLSAFTEIEKQRYARYPSILKYTDFASSRGKKVLEIGCGIGTDSIQFAKNGAIYTGIDLSDAAVNISRERFSLFGQQGNILRTNAENLPFPDNSFDHVYSFGVIHHSPNPERIANEIYRVLKPEGTLTIMLYNRTSFYYLLEVKIIRKIFFSFCDRPRICQTLFSLFNDKLALRFELFRKKLEKIKAVNKTPTGQQWTSMNTDDVFCPLARVYSRAEAKRLFNQFRDAKSYVWFIDEDNWFLWLVFGRFIPKRLEKWLESNFGWFRMIQAKK